MNEQAIADFLEEKIDKKEIPGAVLLVSQHGEVLFHEAYGYRHTQTDKAPMMKDTIFDVASLTKVVATLPATLSLLEEGKLGLSDPVGYFLPAFTDRFEEKVRIIHLLTHTSGLVADWYPLPTDLTEEQLIANICSQGPSSPPGKQVVYSDLGMILLYKIIEGITGERYDRYLGRRVFQPLEMNATGFNPAFDRSRYAATEFAPHLNAYKVGLVHDEKAELMGGISGHAGLFSTAEDLHRFACMIEQDGMHQGTRILRKPAVKLSKQNFTSFDEEYRGLGWAMKNPLTPCSGGDLLSLSSYGHTGFTGTSIWFEPDISLHIILLTNRVHFGRQDHLLRLRPRLHNLIRSYF